MTREETIAMLLQEIKAQSETIESLRRAIDQSHQINNGLGETIHAMRRAIEESNETIAALNNTIEELNQTVRDLKAQLGMNSRNSSKPPSTDGLKKPTPKSLRGESEKKVGGQKGHPGSTLKIMMEPDETVKHLPNDCDGCRNRGICMSRAGVGETRHVVDADVRVKVTAHQAVFMPECPLTGSAVKGKFPNDVNAPVQYGENFQALVVAMNTVGAVSVERIHEMLSSMFNIPLSTGTVANMVSRCAERLSSIVDAIGDKASASGLLHLDETGARVDGKTMWVHNASNSEYTHLTISEKRGREGMDAGGVLPRFTGIAVHDCWAPYWKYKGITHALCCAHLLRELIGILENQPWQLWAKEFIELLLDMKKAKEEAVERGEDRMSEQILEKFESKYETIIFLAKIVNPIPENEKARKGRKKKGKARSLIERLEEYEAAVCLFINDFAVPFDNNMAERDQRMVKTKIKVSGCFRRKKGAEQYLKIMSYVGTAKKQKINPFEAIRQAILGRSEFIFAKLAE